MAANVSKTATNANPFFPPTEIISSAQPRKEKNIKIIKAKKIGNLDCKMFPGDTNGEIISANKKVGLLVRCNKKEVIKIELLKPKDKNIMHALDFINGYPIKIGDIFE